MFYERFSFDAITWAVVDLLDPVYKVADTTCDILFPKVTRNVIVPGRELKDFDDSRLDLFLGLENVVGSVYGNEVVVKRSEKNRIDFDQLSETHYGITYGPDKFRLGELKFDERKRVKLDLSGKPVISRNSRLTVQIENVGPGVSVTYSGAFRKVRPGETRDVRVGGELIREFNPLEIFTQEIGNRY